MFDLDAEDKKAKGEYPEDYLLGYKHGRQCYLDCIIKQEALKPSFAIKIELQHIAWTLGAYDGYLDELDADTTIK